jgi:transcriptional regulator with XRE-family HTH domain
MPHLTDTGAALESNGRRLAGLRMRRRWTQQRLATETGYSLAAVKAFEQGRRSLDRQSVILTFARALDCHPTEITGQPAAPAGDDEETQDAVAAVAAVHRALLRHGRPRIDRDPEQVDLPDLRRRVAEANRYRQTAALHRSGTLLPSLLHDLQVATCLLTGDQQREAHRLLMIGYECTRQFLYKLGRAQATTLATERLLWAADDTEDPVRGVLARGWYEAADLLNHGEHDLAGDIIDGALTELGAMRSDGPELVSLRGALHLRAALNQARATDAKEAQRHMSAAAAAADELAEDRNDFELQFGPTNVAIWSVTIPVELGRGRDAVRQAERVTLPAHVAPERQSHHWIDVGRGYWHNNQRDKALEAFLQAEQIAPQQTRMHPAVRETVRTMIRTQRRSALLELGMRVGAV